MPDFEAPIIGDAGAFERGAKDILARAEAALRATVQTLGEMRGVAGQIEAAATASAGEERAADAINRKAAAAERAADAIARQNAEMRGAGADAAAQDRAAVAMERRAAAAERLARAGAAPGQGALFDESAGTQPRLFPTTPAQAPLLAGYQRGAADLAATNAQARALAESEQRLAVMGREAAAEQVRLAAAEREAGAAGASATGHIGNMARGYAEFLGIAAGVGVGISAFHHIVQGAQQAQEGVQDLKRVVRDLNVDQAVGGFRELAQQYNVPIQEAAQAQFGFARAFATQPDPQGQSFAATRAALAATKLDAIGAADSVRYLTVAVQAFHLTGQQLSARGGVFDQLENVSRRMGVPVGQLMQSFRALPAVANTGGNITDFIALAATMARASGRSGTEINTAVARAATNFVPRNAEAIRSQFGLDPNESITQLLIDAARRSRTLNQGQRRELANLIGGPLRGGSTILGLLNRPDTLEESLKQADPRQAAGAAEQEMRQVMGRIDTQVQEVGRHLANFGAALAQSGVLNGLGLMAHLLTAVVDEATAVADIFHAIPGHGIIAPVAEAAGLVAVLRRANVGERLGGPLSFLSGPLSSPTAAGRDALSAERQAVADSLSRTRSQATSATADMGIAAGTGNEEAALAAQARLNALREREAWLVGQSATLATRTAEQQMAVNAARERELLAQRGEVAVEAEQVGAAAAAGGLAGTKGVVGRGGLVSLLGGLVGGAAGAFGALRENPLGAVRGGLNSGLGSLAVYFASAQMLQGVVNTHGNALERLAGGGRSVLDTVGLGGLSGPLTHDEQRKAGADAAQRFISALPGGADFNADNESQMNQRRMALTTQLAVIDKATNISQRQADVETALIQAELDHETALEQASAKLRRARESGAPIGGNDLLGLNAKELAAVQATALGPMTAVGDDRGLGQGIAVAEAFATLGHSKGRQDLLAKADQAIKANVQAITSELSDNLALAQNSTQRAESYDQALRDAQKLIESSSPAQQRAGELLRRQTLIQRAQDDATTRTTNAGIAAAEHPGATVANAQRAATAARRNYLELADKGLAQTQEGRQAHQKYIEAQNQAADASLQRIQIETATAQAGQQTTAGSDRALVQGLQRQIAAARNAPHPDSNKLTDLYNQLGTARAQLAQQDMTDANAALDAHYSYLEATTDDPLQQALYAYQDALGQRLDKTDPQAAAKKRAAVAQRAQAVRQAQRQQAQDLIGGNQATRDAAIDPFDQVALDRSAERAARESLANLSPTADVGQRRSAQANVIAAQHKTVRDRQQMAYDDIEFNAQIGKYTTDMEVAALRRLESTVKNNRALKRQIEGQIYQLTHQTGGDLQLNLGALRLPSPYEVNRAIREGGAATSRGQVAVHNHNQVNVTVARREDAVHVARHIDHALKTSTRSALRAAGVL